MKTILILLTKLIAPTLAITLAIYGFNNYTLTDIRYWLFLLITIPCYKYYSDLVDDIL